MYCVDTFSIRESNNPACTRIIASHAKLNPGNNGEAHRSPGTDPCRGTETPAPLSRIDVVPDKTLHVAAAELARSNGHHACWYAQAVVGGIHQAPVVCRQGRKCHRDGHHPDAGGSIAFANCCA
jgi:hypothetical protein